ncbi:hypothetical protein JKP88DRAFT_295673 [Tribonema minus]|uniref:Uncharacterized protein n=1 Tax=Tribonema minus TaxID=303371 RepID=A0A835ZG12_9STRA|nr:hypothetical protein JKP88DRAFT_295673 [Tribonema minus]
MALCLVQLLGIALLLDGPRVAYATQNVTLHPALLQQELSCVRSAYLLFNSSAGAAHRPALTRTPHLHTVQGAGGNISDTMAMQAEEEAHEEAAYGYVCSRAEAIMRQLAKGGPALASPSADAELYGLHAIATRLSAVGGRFRGLEPILARLAAARDCRAEPAADRTDLCVAQGTPHAALGDRVILGHILQFTGKRSWVYIAGVSPHWRGAYMATCAMQFGLAHLCRTSWREVLTSVETFVAAADAGALEETHQPALQHQLGRWGSRALVACATGAGFDVPLHGPILVGAAETGRADWFVYLGQLLVKRGRLGIEDAIKAAVAAARRGDSGEVMAWIASLKLAGVPRWIVAGLAAVAARHGHLATLRWMITHADDCWGFKLGLGVIEAYFDNLPQRSVEEGAAYGCFEPDVMTPDGDGEYHILTETAIRSGHMHIVDYIAAELHEYVIDDTVALAVQIGRVDMAQALLTTWDAAAEDLVEDVLPALAREPSCPVALFEFARAYSTAVWPAEDLSAMLPAANEVQNAPLAAWLRSIGAE